VIGRFGNPLGIGAFAGRDEPQATDVAEAGELRSSLLGPGGVRVALTSLKGRRYTGGALSPQTFLAPPAYPNHPDSLETAARTGVGNYRRALNRQRGRLPIA
jgi:hypothetical protein